MVVCTWMVPCWVGLCPYTVTTPLIDIGGSGGAQAGSGSSKYGEAVGYKNNAFESKLYGGALISPAFVPALWRYWGTGPGATLDSNGGLQAHYRDMKDPTIAASLPKNQTAEENGGKYPITVEVERPAATLRLSTSILKNSDKLLLADEMKGSTMRALSSAHAYFYRSKVDDLKQFTRNGWRRADNHTEYQSLFSPYWQARLVPTSAAEEGASALAQ